MKEVSWRRLHEQEPWRRNHGGGIMVEESGRRNHGGGEIMEEGSWRRLLRGFSEASGRHLETPRKHPGNT